MTDSRSKTSSQDTPLKAALEELGKAQPARQGYLAAALKRISDAQGHESNAALKAATAHQSNLAEALRKISEGQTQAPNAPLKAALEKLGKAQSARQNHLAAALKRISDAQGHESNAALKAATAHQSNLAEALRKISEGQTQNTALGAATLRIRVATDDPVRTDSVNAAWRAGLRNGVEQVTAFNLNPWIKPLGSYEESPSETLRSDWLKVEADLRTTISRLRDQLDELPRADRERVVDRLIQYLQPRSSA
jgi:uncharacterized phage infection (PIP) family protein YhgE